MPRNAVLTHATRVGPEETDRAFLTALDDDEHPMRLIARTSDGRENSQML